MLDLAVLEQFVAFYHAGTLAEAAERLHISQPTLTRGMQKLEAEFGVPLFCRTKNRIALNEAGSLAAMDAEMLLRQYENMLYRARELDRRSRTIYVGACAPVPVTGVVQRLTALFSGAAITSELKGIPDLETGLAENRYQLVILPHAPEDKGLCAVPLGKEQIFFCLHKSHRFAERKSIRTAEMNGENMLLFQDIGFWYDLTVQKMPDSRFLMQTERYNFTELAENSVLSFFATEAGEYARPHPDRVKIPIEDPEFTVTYHLVCKKEYHARFKTLFEAVRGEEFL